MADEEKYAKVKKYVLSEIGHEYDLEKLKDYFKEEIDSPRAFKKIRTIEDLIVVLEQRDCLNYKSPMPLFYIGEIIENGNIKHAITFYKKCYLEGQNIVCLCGQEIDYCPSSTHLQPEGNSFKPTPNTDLMDAIKNVAEQIGKFWRVLTSQLKVEECVIDEIIKKYPRSEQMKALAAMEHWMAKEKENATIEQLDKALEARLCKIKGIGSHLRKPIPKLCV